VVTICINLCVTLLICHTVVLNSVELPYFALRRVLFVDEATFCLSLIAVPGQRQLGETGAELRTNSGKHV
jgi:hypothetical protein